jgi:hypothetical protein
LIGREGGRGGDGRDQVKSFKQERVLCKDHRNQLKTLPPVKEGTVTYYCVSVKPMS